MSLFHSSMWMWIEIMLSDVFSDSDISVKLVKREQEGSSQLWGGGACTVENINLFLFVFLSPHSF